jgi:hypothetical protein
LVVEVVEMVVHLLVVVLVVLVVQAVEIVPPILLVLPHNHLNHNLQGLQTMEMLAEQVLLDAQVETVVEEEVVLEHLEHRIQEDLLVEMGYKHHHHLEILHQQ